MTWEPIETAPKDGAIVDLWVTSGPRSMRDADCFWADPGKWIDNCGDPVEVAGWRATHWMPLPDPPDGAA